LKTRLALVIAVQAPTSRNRKEGRRNSPTNQNILPHLSCHVEWKWKGCPWPPLTFQTV